MPGFAHIIIGLGISIFLYKITEGKFTTKHALVFTVNNLFGPDLSSLFPTIDSFFWSGLEIPIIYYFFHGFGWFVVALALVIPWDAIVNWKERAMKLPQVYFLIVAGGLLHLFVDIIGHPSYIEYAGQENYPWGAVWIGWDLHGKAIFMSIEDIWATGVFPCGNHFNFLETTIFYTISFVVILGILFFYSRKDEKHLIKSFIIINLVYTLPLIIFYYIPDYSGFDVTKTSVTFFGNPDNVHSTYRLIGGETDLAVLLYFFLFFSVPFILIYYSFNDKLAKKPIEKNKQVIAVKKEEEKKQSQDEDIKFKSKIEKE